MKFRDNVLPRCLELHVASEKELTCLVTTPFCPKKTFD
jgi:hypothetical protein